MNSTIAGSLHIRDDIAGEQISRMLHMYAQPASRDRSKAIGKEIETHFGASRDMVYEVRCGIGDPFRFHET